MATRSSKEHHGSPYDWSVKSDWWPSLLSYLAINWEVIMRTGPSARNFSNLYNWSLKAMLFIIKSFNIIPQIINPATCRIWKVFPDWMQLVSNCYNFDLITVKSICHDCLLKGWHWSNDTWPTDWLWVSLSYTTIVTGNQITWSLCAICRKTSTEKWQLVA